MNIQALHDTITTQYTHKVTDLVDGAAYAYVVKMLEHIKSVGADPADYEVVIGHDTTPQYIEKEDGTTIRVSQHIRLERRKDLENLPVLRDEA
jgi:hypothetical protein